MNKAILIVICDFLVSAMLTMMTGMVPGHSGGTGVGLDEKTTRVLLFELNRRQLELEAMRLQLREAISRSGISPERQAELRRLTEELIANLAQQEKLEGKLIAKAADSADMDSLRDKLSAEELRRRQLEEELARLKGDLAGNLQKLADVSGDLRDKRRDNAVLTRQLEQTRDSLGETGKKLDETQQQLLAERSRHGETQVKLSVAERDKSAAQREAAEKGKALDAAREKLAGTQERLDREKSAHGSTREKLAASESGRKAAEKEAAEKGKALDAAGKKLAGTEERLERERSAHGSTREKLAASESGRKAAEREAAEKGKALDAAGRKLEAEHAANVKAAGEIARFDTQLRAQQRTITALKGDLSGSERQLAAANERVNALEIIVSRRDGALEENQRENASLKDESAKAKQEAMVAKLEMQEEKTKRIMMEETLRAAVKELSEKDAELKKALADKNSAAVAAVAELVQQKTLQNQGAAAAPVRKDVYRLYAQAILRVDCDVREKTGLFNNELGGNVISYYPVVDFGEGRVLITGSFDRFAGDFEKVLDFKEVVKVAMSWQLPYDNNAKNRTRLTGEMIVNSKFRHLAGFKFVSRDKTIVPLKAIGHRTLKERGLDNLSLFKCDAEANHTVLDGRVSLINSDSGPALFIRNGGGSQLLAAPGDMVMTVQGEFVGIVSRRIRNNNVNGVLVPLFDDVSADWDKIEMVRLKEVSKDNYSDYGNKIRELRKIYPR